MKDNRTIAESTAEAPPGLQAPFDEPTTDSGKKRILVVDDEVSATRLLKLNLEQTNQYVVRTESDPRKALAAATEFHPDLMFLDVLMPGMGGGDLASFLLADPMLKSVPIVFLTAMATKNEIHRRGGRIGGFPFLAKPVDLNEVLACLNLHLDAPRS